MSDASKDEPRTSMIKVVYFDEESASDYLDIAAGGKKASTSEDIQQRSKEMHGKVEAGLFARLGWLPFLGSSGELGGGAGVSAAGNSILSKTLSNTILTDYLTAASGDPRVIQLRNVRVTAPKDSMAYMKMFTPYMVIAKTENLGIDLARLDEALAGAKGYYELLGEDGEGPKQVLRFNIKAFRNNYGLADLGRMRLVFHGIHVGCTTERGLGMQAEMSSARGDGPLTAANLVDAVDGTSDISGDLLDVYDVVLAGIEHVG
jgi:Family of unknown function (DUF6414)